MQTIVKPIFVYMVILSGTVHASVVIVATEVAGDIVFTGAGSINLDSTTGFAGSLDLGYRYNGFVDDSDPTYLGIIPENGDRYSHTGISTTGASKDNAVSFPLTGPTPRVGAFVNSLNNVVVVSDSYISNTPINFTATLLGQTFASLGLQDGDFSRAEWSNNGVTDWIQIYYSNTGIPEPTTSALALAAILCLTFRLRRYHARE